MADTGEGECGGCGSGVKAGVRDQGLGFREKQKAAFEVAFLFGGSIPSGLKPGSLASLMYGLKPVPFTLKPRGLRLKTEHAAEGLFVAEGDYGLDFHGSAGGDEGGGEGYHG